MKRGAIKPPTITNTDVEAPVGKKNGGKISVSGESTPLLSAADGGGGVSPGSGAGGGSSSVSINVHNEPPPLKDMKAESIKERGVAGIAFVGFMTSFLSLVLQAASHPTVIVSGLLGSILSPLAAIQQGKLTQVEALDQTNERMEQEVQQLSVENVKLQKQVKHMEESVLNLQAMKETLNAIQSLQGQSVKELERQLQTSREILSRMHTNYKTDLLQNIMTVLLAVDSDNNMKLTDEEIDELIHRMESIHGVELKEQLLKDTIIKKGRSVAAVMEIARHILCDDDIPEECNIFSYIEDQ